MQNSISIIIPAKNEAASITRCLESINNCKENSLIKEIIVVDCCSEDKTVEIASRYPVKILQLKPDWPHSPAAARYIGSLFSHGELIFFIDSDMIIDPEFLQKAIEIMESDRRIAGLSGIGKEIYLKNNKPVGGKDNLYKTNKLTQETNFLGGAALYRKKILIETGGFNPHLKAGEEIELAQRLRKNYRLLSIPYSMITHYTAPLNEWKEFMRKKKNGLFLGIGQSLRITHSLRFLFESLFYYKEYLFFVSLIMLSVLSTTFAFLTGKLQYFLFLPIVISALFCFLLAKNKGFKKASISLIKWLIISIEITRGLLIKPKNPKDYPDNPDIIKGDFNA